MTAINSSSSSSCSSFCSCPYGVFCVVAFARRELKRSLESDYTTQSIEANINFIQGIYPCSTHEEVGFFVLKFLVLILAGDDLNMSTEEKLELFSSIMDSVDFWGMTTEHDVKHVAYFCLIIANGNTEEFLSEYPINEKSMWEEREAIRKAAEEKEKENLDNSLAHRCENYGGTWVWSLIRVWWDEVGKIIYIDKGLSSRDVGHWTQSEIRTQTELLEDDIGVEDQCPPEIINWRRFRPLE